MFSPEEEKNIILKWFYDLYKRLGGMTMDEIYAYLLGLSKEQLVGEVDALLGKEDYEASEKEQDLITYQGNVKDMQKKLRKL